MTIKFITPLVVCVILSLIDLLFATSYNINLIITSNRSTHINSHHEPVFLCGPDYEDRNDCTNPQFRHNGSIIDTSGPKYSVTFVSLTHRSTLRVHNVVPSDAGTYDCGYSCGSVGYVYSDSLTLIFVPPIIFHVPNNITYHQYVGSNVTLQCSAINYDILQWQYHNGEAITELEGKYHFEGTNLIVSNVTAEDEALYYCAANNMIEVRVDITAFLKVYMKPTTVAVSNINITVFEGNTTFFVCTATGIPRPHIIWSNDNDLNIGGRIQKHQKNIDEHGVSSNLTISIVQRSDQGKYKCAGGNDNGTSTIIFTLTVIIPPTPSLYLNLENINSSSISVSWTVTGVSPVATVTIVWRTYDGVIVGNKVVPQDSFPIIVSSLQANTSYTFTVTVLSLNNSLSITTIPEEPYSSTLLSFGDMSSTASIVPTMTSVILFISQSFTDVASFYSSTSASISSATNIVVSSSLVKTATPSPVAIVNNSLTFGIGVACSIAVVLILAIIIISLGVCFIARTKQWSKRTLNIQSIDKQNSVRSDCQLLGETKGYSTRTSGVSLNSLHNGGLASPSYAEDFHEMTVNPHFAGTGPTLSQESASVYNTCSSCPPFPGKAQDNLYQIESYGYEEFEMTDNPHYDYDTSRPNYVHVPIDPYSTSKWISGSDSESASQMHYYSKSPNENDKFEFNENSNYECTPAMKSPVTALQFPVYSSDMSLSRTQSPRFQIVSDKRGGIREEVNLVNQC